MSEKITFSATQKICALAMRFYQGMKWNPQVGDYYCLTRDGLELWQIRESDGENFFIRKVCHPSQEMLLPQDSNDAWKITEFQSGFGVNRVWVHPSVLEKVK